MTGPRTLSLLALAGLSCNVFGQATPPQTQPGQTTPPTTAPPPTTQNLTPPIQPQLAPVHPAVNVPVQPPPAVSPEPKPMTAEEAAMIALRHAPTIAIAKAAAQMAHGQALVSSDALFPGITVESGFIESYQLNLGRAAGGGTGAGGRPLSSTGFNASISLSQLVFDFNKTLDTVKEAEALARASTYAYTESQSDAIYTVKQNFYLYAQAVQTVDSDEANLRDTQDNLALAQARLNTGLGLPGDVVTAETNMAAATVALITAQNNATQAQVTLALSMGIDPRTPIKPQLSEEHGLTSDDTSVLVDQALRQRPDMREMEENIRAAGFGISAARKYLLPSLALSASVSAAGPLQPFTNQYASYGLEVTWTPFDLVGYKGRLEEAEAQRASFQAQLQQTVQTVQSQVAQAYLNEKNAEQQVTVSNAEIANATEGLRIAEGQYRNGLATFVTVINAETQLATARADQVNANAQLQLARAAMEHALGKPL